MDESIWVARLVVGVELLYVGGRIRSPPRAPCGA
jgi:hypothetical protein